jgi:hypothetical protein
MEVVQPHVLAIGSLVPVQKSSPERRNQKEIVAGEERPKFLTIKETENAQGTTSLSFITEIHFTSDTLEEFSDFIANAEKEIQTFFALFNPHRAVKLFSFRLFFRFLTHPLGVYDSRKHTSLLRVIYSSEIINKLVERKSCVDPTHASCLADS